MYLLPMLPYLTISAFHLTCCLLPGGAARKAQNASKVLLMPALLLFCLLAGTGGLLPAAILCGWLGDILLLFPPEEPRTARGLAAFLAGVAAFLTGHILYIAALAGISAISAPLPAVPLACALAAVGAAAYATLHRRLAGLRIPVAAYLLVILTMAFFALLPLFGGAGVSVPRLVTALGAVNFVISDYLLARSLFLSAKRSGIMDFLVMLFYLAAQAGLIVGLSLPL